MMILGMFYIVLLFGCPTYYHGLSCILCQPLHFLGPAGRQEDSEMAILSHNPTTASPFPSRGKQHVPLHPVYTDQYGTFFGGEHDENRTMA